MKRTAESSRTGQAGLLRAGFLVAVACLAARLEGAQSAPPDRADAAALLDKFRRSVCAEPIYVDFDLREMPRRGDERVFHGRFWGARNERGPITRLELDVGRGGFTHRILVQGGADGALWTSDGPRGGSPSEVAAMQPLVPGVEMTPFDLQMPYLYWLDFSLAGTQRIRGRPAYLYVFTPPGDFRAANPGITAVRAYLDTQYDALVQSEVAGAGGHVSKTLSLLELRKVGDRWILKDVDVRNEATRDKTRLTVTGLAVGIQVDPSAFDPSRLGADLAPPPTGSITRITQ